MEIEVEHCWCVLPPDPEVTLDALGHLETLADAALGPARSIALEDRVLDLPDGALRAAGLTLRLRVADGRPRVTVKGPSTTDADGAVHRPEWEEEWLPDAGARALRLLAEWGGPELGPPPARPVAPLEQLAAVGLSTVQARHTGRRLRTLADPAGSVLGELALDRVRFEPGGRTVRHAEVELELAPGGDASALAAAASALAEAGGDRLRPWPFSKTALGAALEHRAVDGRLEQDLDASGRPTRDAYLELERALRGRARP